MRISVLLPAWRAEKTVGEAVADVLGQRWRDLELIVIHQGGDDPTLEVLRRVRDPRFHLLRRDEPGTALALEMGRAAASGEWIGRMDADDRCPPTRLAEQVAHADRTGAPVLSCRVEPFPGGREAYCAWQNSLCTHEQMAAERFIEVPWFHATMLARPEALDAVGGWRPGDFLEDYDLVLRLFAAGIRQEKLPEVRYRWRIHPAQTTASWPAHKIRRQKVEALDLPADAYLVGTGRSLEAWAALLGRPALAVDLGRPLDLPPGFPVLVVGSAPVRQRLRAALGERPHLFVA
ncbi:glycosyltransferase family 2 protein [Myxococcota bacterium]|nr:glycosyltransferase family 2 protein [Myxococcota bacterium]